MEEETKQTGDTFDEVRAALDGGSLGRAEELLGEMEERNAEWYYLQSILFRKKYWFLESKKSLEQAIKLDSKNKTYRDAMKETEACIKEEKKNRKAIEKAIAKDKNMAGNAFCAICEGMCDGCNGC